MSPLYSSIKSGDIDNILLILNQGVETDVDCYGLDTPLRYAVRKDQVEVVALLLERKANPDYRYSRLFPPLSVCAAAQNPNRIAITELLLTYGANVNNGKKTPLELAVDQSDIPLIRVLLNAKADRKLLPSEKQSVLDSLLAE